MSNLTRTLLLVLALPALLMALGETGLTKSFRQPGEPGSFEARFSKLTAGIVWLKAKDHFVSVEAANHEVKESGDFLLLVDNANHALRLFQPEGAVFGKNPADAPWQMDEFDGGVKFTLADDQGLILEKVFEYEEPDGRFAEMLGDVKKLPNGNYLVAWSTAGYLTEIDTEGNVVWQADMEIGNVVARTTWISDLYSMF